VFILESSVTAAELIYTVFAVLKTNNTVAYTFNVPSATGPTVLP
jgi:hypothetical protein